MGCEDKKFKRIRAVDVGRKGHHFIKVGIRDISGPHGGVTEQIGPLRLYKKKK